MGSEQRVLDVQEYQAHMKDLLGAHWVARLGSEEVGVDAPEALGRILSEDMHARIDLPPFTNSQLDGYAVRAVDLKGAGPNKARALRVGPMVPAGEVPLPLQPGYAAPIMTGAALPAGADAVVPIEQADPNHFLDFDTDDGAATARHDVRFYAEPAPGEGVREQGSDIRSGELLVAAGQSLTPARLGVLAATGRRTVPVGRRPHVLVVATGAELQDSSAQLQPARIYDANSVMLGAALRQAGARVSTLRVSDNPGEFESGIARALGGAHGVIDLVVSAGGISKGAFEVVRQALGSNGWFGKVAMQPGGPQGYGVIPVHAPDADTSNPAGVPFVAFPGNPVSALISFELFVRPILLRATGHASLVGERPQLQARLAEPVDSIPGKLQVRRGRLNDYGHVEMVGGPSSHLLSSYANATHLVFLPAEAARLEAGDLVSLWQVA